MSLEQSLTTDIVAAMRAKDATRLTAWRMLKTALTNKSIEKGRALEGAEELQVVPTLVKQRRDSIEQFTSGGRKDLAAAASADEVSVALEAAMAGTAQASISLAGSATASPPPSPRPPASAPPRRPARSCRGWPATRRRARSTARRDPSGARESRR